MTPPAAVPAPAAATAPETPAAPSPSGQGRWVLLSTILASSMAFIDGTAVSVALPVLQRDLGASGAQLLWVVDGYLLMLAAFILVGGSLGDRLGRKRIFMEGIVIFALASLACGFSPSTDFLIAARVVQGLGGALMIPGSLSIITACFSRERRGRAIGTWSAATTIVVVLGPFLGGLLSELGLWRGVFLINLPLAVASLIILRLKVPESRDEESGPLDLPGAALAAAGLALLTYGFISAPADGFRSPGIYGPLALGALLLGTLVLRESRSSHPMLPLGMFRSRNFSGANLQTLFLYGALNISTLFLPLNLVQVQGYTPLAAGLVFLPFGVLLAGLSRWSGGLVDRFGPRLPLTIGPAAVAAGFLLMALPGVTGGPADFWRTYLPGVLVFGTGMGLTVAPLTTTVMTSLPERFAGTESGINNAVSRVAGVLAIAIMGAVALLTFTHLLDGNAQGLGLTSQVRQELRAEASRLGEADVPADVAAGRQPAVRQAIRESFVGTYRLVMVICAALALVSVLMVQLLFRGGGGDSRRRR